MLSVVNSGCNNRKHYSVIKENKIDIGNKREFTKAIWAYRSAYYRYVL